MKGAAVTEVTSYSTVTSCSGEFNERNGDRWREQAPVPSDRSLRGDILSNAAPTVPAAITSLRYGVWKAHPAGNERGPVLTAAARFVTSRPEIVTNALANFAMGRPSATAVPPAKTALDDETHTAVMALAGTVRAVQPSAVGEFVTSLEKALYSGGALASVAKDSAIVAMHWDRGSSLVNYRHHLGFSTVDKRDREGGVLGVRRSRRIYTCRRVSLDARRNFQIAERGGRASRTSQSGTCRLVLDQ